MNLTLIPLACGKEDEGDARHEEENRFEHPQLYLRLELNRKRVHPNEPRQPILAFDSPGGFVQVNCFELLETCAYQDLLCLFGSVDEDFLLAAYPLQWSRGWMVPPPAFQHCLLDLPYGQVKGFLVPGSTPGSFWVLLDFTDDFLGGGVGATGVEGFVVYLFRYWSSTFCLSLPLFDNSSTDDELDTSAKGGGGLNPYLEWPSVPNVDGAAFRSLEVFLVFDD